MGGEILYATVAYALTSVFALFPVDVVDFARRVNAEMACMHGCGGMASRQVDRWGQVGMNTRRRQCYAYFQDGTDRSLALARVNRLLSAPRCQMDTPTIASILAITGGSGSPRLLVDRTIGGQEWVLSMSTTCREMRGLYRSWRCLLVSMAKRRLQELEVERRRL